MSTAHKEPGGWPSFPPGPAGLVPGACGGADELLCVEAFLRTQDAAIWGEVLAQRGPAEFKVN